MTSRRNRALLAALAGLVGLLLAGCTTLGYYAQAVDGHLRVMARARPVADIVADATTEPLLREQLQSASAIREFASRELALPDNGHYRSYADLGRPYVVWNVFAAPEFSVELEQWCMLVVGCVSYRGYYDRADASAFADELHASASDVHVAGVPAYSTLGYFADPLLNTFVRLGEREVARLVFHELAHQLLYVRGDSTFNESFATAVENEGVRRWLGRSAPAALPAFEARQQRRGDFERLIAEQREALRALYASDLPAAAKRAAKAQAIEGLRRAYAMLKARWGGYAGYDAWFAQPLNNATLASLTLYGRWVPAFAAILADEAGDLPRFYARVRQLAELPKSERSRELERLLPEASSASSWPAPSAGSRFTPPDPTASEQ